MIEVLRGSAQEVVIRVVGPLDPGARAELACCVGGLGAAATLVVDFVRPELLRDADLGALVRPLAGVARLRLRGLSRHHLRVLRYCGVREAAGPPRAAEG